MTARRKRDSIQGLSRWLFGLLLPLTFLLGVVSVVQIQLAYRNEKHDTEQAFEGLLLRLEEELTKPESYLSNLLMQSAAVQVLEHTQDTEEQYFAKQELYDAFGLYLAQNRLITVLALYCADTDVYLERDNGMDWLEPSRRQKLRVALQLEYPQACRDGQVQNEWNVSKLDDGVFLHRTMMLQNCYAFCAIDMRQVIGWLEENAGTNVQILVPTQNAFQMERQPESWDKTISSLRPGQSMTLENGSMAVCSEFCGTEMIAVSYHTRALHLSSIMTTLLAVLAFTTILIVAFHFWVWNRQILQPLQTLKQTMEDIRAGQLRSRAVNEQAGAELQEINEVFNQMMENIRNLKIEGYEKELRNREIQLEYYYHQIRPHFYLNCLKNLYALSAKGDTARMEQSILLMSAYLRHTLQQNNQAVTLQEEVVQCQNYVDLIGISSSCPPEIICRVEDEMKEIPVPAVSLLTLVENSLKHTGSFDKRVTIEIEARLLPMEEQSCLYIRVKDNGTGFTETELENLNQMDWSADTAGHVGLKNVVQRFQLMYRGETHMVFCNERGAVVELYVPVEREGGVL